MERTYGHFCLGITMPFKPESERIEAELKNGLLTLTIPKSQELLDQTKIIKIKSKKSPN